MGHLGMPVRSLDPGCRCAMLKAESGALAVETRLAWACEGHSLLLHTTFQGHCEKLV